LASAPQPTPSTSHDHADPDRSESPALLQAQGSTPVSLSGTTSPHAKPRRRKGAVDEGLLTALSDAAGSTAA
jgi:hypothetical protein